MIRTLLVDDHPAMRAGLTAVLGAEPGIVPVGTASTAFELTAALRSTRPDVILMDYHLSEGDGLTFCRQVKRSIPAPKVLVYSAYADTALAVPAVLAGADGLLHKGAPASELYHAIRCVARGDRVLPAIGPEQRNEASARLDPEDLPILSLRLEGADLAEVALTMRRPAQEIDERLDVMLERLRVDVPTPGAAA